MAELDHYSVLGVLPTADDVVIRAAYRALAQRYHPDKWLGDPKEATEKMAEINSAYAVLSDPSKRRAFDQTRSAHQNAEPFFREDSEDREPTYDPLVGDWQIAVNFYPDLADLEKGLEKLSWRVAFAYRVEMLEKRQFEHRSEIAQRIEQDYLLRHFGTNPDVLSFARSLIEAENKRAALALNQAIRVLGVSTSADVVIQRIASQYCSDDFETPIKRRLREQTKGSFLGAVKELLT